MPLDKINVSALEAEDRFHSNQADVPGKTAADMKAFMDYIPRQVLIPKINEIIDETYTKTEADGSLSLKADKTYVDTELAKKADASSVYTKTETDGKLDLKANTATTYTKTETDSKLDLKANAATTYTKTETDGKLALKANAAATYTKTETDGLLSSKLSSGSDRIIQDVTSAPQTENTALLCREGEDIKLYKNGSLCPSDGDSAQEFLSPMLCAYSTEAELSAAIEAHGLTDTTQSGTAAIHLFDLYKQDGTLVDKLYIIRFRKALYVRNQDANVTLNMWSLAQWAGNTADIYSYFEGKGYPNTILENVSAFAKQSVSKADSVYSKLATEKYVRDFHTNNSYTKKEVDDAIDDAVSDKLPKSNPQFTGTLSASKGTADNTDIFDVGLETSGSSTEFKAKALYDTDGYVNGFEVSSGVPLDVTGVRKIETMDGKDIVAMMNSISVIINSFPSSDSWAGIQNAVRSGYAPFMFPVGYEFSVHDSDSGLDYPFVVVGHNHHKAANTALKRTMTIVSKYVYSKNNGIFSPVEYAGQEALYYAAEGLSAGTYNFTIANNKWITSENDKTYQFTLTKPVPAGGQIAVSAKYNQSFAGKSVKTYPCIFSDDAIETATLTEGNAGTSLGTTDGTGSMNHLYRIAVGPNNYAQSAIRQWLNSAAATGSVFAPKTVFSRPPAYLVTYNGFMHGLPEDFLAVVQPAVIPCHTNSVLEMNSLDGTEFAVNQVYNVTDKFFLLSRPEIYGTWSDANYKDGELLDYYNGLTNAERIKCDVSGVACYIWTRSPNRASMSDYVWRIDANGALGTGGALNNHAVAPACIIA